ncbi:GHKL domain-containing protein, partial [uncultured Tyzzerella sp.]
SLKRRNSKYGLGLKSIKNIVNKYNGNMKIKLENNIFKTKIILILDK